MNNLSIICGVLSLSVILANFGSIHAPDPKSKSSKPIKISPTSENQAPAIQSSQSAPSKPASLSCILFKELGCTVQCTLLARLQDFTSSSAVCDSNLACNCTIEEASLRDLWNKIFYPHNILHKIIKDKPLAQKITKLLSDPSRTNEQSERDVRAILPDHLVKYLRLQQNTTPANQRKTNLNDLKKRVTIQVKAPLKKSPLYQSQSMEYLDWVTSFYDYLEKKKTNPAIQLVYHQVRDSENQLLQEYLEKFLKENRDAVREDTDKEYEEDAWLPNIVTSMVIDRMINEIGVPNTISQEDDEDSDDNESTP